MTEPRLHELCDAVHDEPSFLRFLDALIRDREAAVAAEKERPSGKWDDSPQGWANWSIEQYLESAQAWAVDSRFGRGEITKPDPSKDLWQVFASFLYAGKIYE